MTNYIRDLSQAQYDVLVRDAMSWRSYQNKLGPLTLPEWCIFLLDMLASENKDLREEVATLKKAKTQYRASERVGPIK